MALPSDKRRAYLGGLQALAAIVRNYVEGKSANVNVFEEFCLERTLDVIKAVTEAAPNSWIAKDLVYALSAALMKLWRHPALFGGISRPHEA